MHASPPMLPGSTASPAPLLAPPSSLQGMIFSRALMDVVPLADMERCIALQQWSHPGSDKILSMCLWAAGHAFTDPGHMVEHGRDKDYIVFVSRWLCNYRYTSHTPDGSMCLWAAGHAFRDADTGRARNTHRAHRQGA